MEKEKFDVIKGKIKILGISTAYRSEYACAREDPISMQLLKLALKEAEKSGAETYLIDLRELKIGTCKECYSTCPAQCRFDEESNLCDCYPIKPKVSDTESFDFEEAYDNLNKKEFLEKIQEIYGSNKDEMWKVYKAMRESDGVIFAGFTSFYSRPALMQNMFSRLCALDGGVEELWGDGKNLQNSIAYSKKEDVKYKQRLFGKSVAFVNVSKEGDSMTPDLMKACTMMGMKIIPFSVCYRVNWYKDTSHRNDFKESINDSYAISLAKDIGKNIVEECKKSSRIYGICSKIV